MRIMEGVKTAGREMTGHFREKRTWKERVFLVVESILAVAFAVVIVYWCLFVLEFLLRDFVGWFAGWIVDRQATATGMQAFLLSISPIMLSLGLGLLVWRFTTRFIDAVGPSKSSDEQPAP